MIKKRMMNASRILLKEGKKFQFRISTHPNPFLSIRDLSSSQNPSSAQDHLKREKNILEVRSQEMCYEGSNPSCNEPLIKKSIVGSKLVIPPTRFSENMIEDADYHLNEAMIHIQEANRLVNEEKKAESCVKQVPRESNLLGVFIVIGQALSDSILGRVVRNSLSTMKGLDVLPVKNDSVWLERAEKRDELKRKGVKKFIAVIFEKPTIAMNQGFDCRVRVIDNIDATSLLNSSQSSAATRVDAESGSDSKDSFSSTASFGLPPCIPSNESPSDSTHRLAPGHPSHNVQECIASDNILPPDARVLDDKSLSLFPWPDHPMQTKLATSTPLHNSQS